MHDRTMANESQGPITDHGEVIDGPLLLDHCVIAYERMRSIVYQQRTEQLLRSLCTEDAPHVARTGIAATDRCWMFCRIVVADLRVRLKVNMSIQPDRERVSGSTRRSTLTQLSGAQ